MQLVITAVYLEKCASIVENILSSNDLTGKAEEGQWFYFFYFYYRVK